MFEFQRHDPLLPNPVGGVSRRTLVDRERGWTLHPLPSAQRGSVQRNVLVGHGKEILIETESHTVEDPPGIQCGVITFRCFGSFLLGNSTKVPDYVFASEEEKRELMRIAAEALLIEGTGGHRKFLVQDGRIRVRLMGEVLTLRSFGYDAR